MSEKIVQLWAGEESQTPQELIHRLKLDQDRIKTIGVVFLDKDNNISIAWSNEDALTLIGLFEVAKKEAASRC